MAVLLGVPQPAVARSRGSKAAADASAKPAKDPAERRLREGEAALKAGELVAAERLLSEAYQVRGAPQALFLLGRLAVAQGRTVAAQDFLRRYLAATEDQAVSPEQRAEAERVLLTTPPSGEVAVLGEPGGRVLLDGRLVALLPLPLPLLVTPGNHEVRLELAAARAAAPLAAALTVKAERRVEVRFDRTTAATMVSELPTVLLLLRGRGLPEASEARLQQAVSEVLRRQRLTVLPAKLLVPTGCTEGPRCQLGQLSERALEHALVVDVEALPAASDGKPSPVPTPASDSFRFTVSLLDAQVGDVAHRIEQRCDHCTLDALAAQLATASSDAAAEGMSRRRGNLEVLSEPAGAELELSGRIVGKTPYHGVHFAGSYAAVLRQPGHRPISRPIVVEEGKPAKLQLRFESELGATAGLGDPATVVQPVRFVEQAPRPAWRLLLGGGLIAGGLATAGFGAGALAVDGQCLRPAVAPAQQCDQHYQTTSLGLGLVGAGAAVSLAGVVLMAIPGPRRTFASTVTLAPCPLGGDKVPSGVTGPTPLCATRGGR
ncbi:MAG: PEGA domain-containing protein [Pseudoxanthomonas sp.]